MATYIQIGSTVTVGAGGAANIDFSSIPSTYTDLMLVISGRGSTAANNVDLKLTFNGSTTGYTMRNVYGNGSSAASFSDSTTNYTGANINGSSSTASTFANTSVYIPNYSGSTNKSFSVDNVLENNATFGLNWLHAGLWSNTAAINQITLTPASGNFVQYSTASLYGISKS